MSIEDQLRAMAREEVAAALAELPFAPEEWMSHEEAAARGVYYSLLKDGSKVFFVRHKANANGQRLYERVCTRLDQAKKRAAEIAAVDIAPISVGATFSEEVVEWKAVRRCRPSSERRFDGILRTHIEPFFGNRKLREIGAKGAGIHT